MNHKLQIILVEDEPALLRGLILTISQISDRYEIAATACNGADALQQIISLKPHIVITDIQMPVMNGLDLIEKGMAASPQTAFIILTGYAEFDYAKRAMKLNVMDYLLKPIDPDALEALLKKLEKEYMKKNKDEKLEYIRQYLYSDTHCTDTPNLLNGCSLYLLFTFFGTVTTNLYNEISAGSQIAQDSNYNMLYDLAVYNQVHLSILRGNYFNERVFVFIAETDSNPLGIPAFIKTQIYPRILSEDIFTNCILSERIENGSNLSAHIRSCYLSAASHSLFGLNKLHDCHPLTPGNSPIRVTPEIEKQIICLKPAMEFSDMENLCRSFIKVWRGQETSQFQIQTDLRCIFHALTQKAGQLKHTYPNPYELLCAASSYDDLLQNMLLEFRTIHETLNTLPQLPKPTQQLAFSVRDFLDKNYTQPITYKDFNDIFGYSEKYISLIYKEAFDISPSKYITTLRLTAAKNMMRQNHDILLKDIALAVGYEDPLYFSRVFKNSEGISPKAYQKMDYTQNPTI